MASVAQRFRDQTGGGSRLYPVQHVVRRPEEGDEADEDVQMRLHLGVRAAKALERRPKPGKAVLVLA